jgi:hypothetical protein
MNLIKRQSLMFVLIGFLVSPLFAGKQLVAILETAQEGKSAQLEAVELTYLSEVFGSVKFFL